MLIENATKAQTQVRFVPYRGIVNPEHTNGLNYVPLVHRDDRDDDDANSSLEKIFVEDFLRKSTEFRLKEQLDFLPIDIRLGTVYTYQNRRQQNQHPNSLKLEKINASGLRNEERRPRQDKHFLITFNKNKGINDVPLFEHQLTCAGFRQTNEQQLTYRLYLQHQNRRLILELQRNTNDERFFSVKRLLKYSAKYTHIDVVKSKANTNYPEAFDDVYDIRTSMGKTEEEELHINDDYCDFLHAKDLDRCVFETISASNQPVYQFHRALMAYFDFFQIKQTTIYDYSCMDSRFFGVRVFLEHQIGYDLCSSSRTTTPCVRTKNVIMAKVLSSEFTEEEAKRIWTISTWLSELATRCTNQDFPLNAIFSRRPGQARRTVRSHFHTETVPLFFKQYD